MSSGRGEDLILMDPTLERTFRGHKSYITSVSFSPTLKQLASSSADNSILLWNFKPQLRAFRFVGHKGVVTDVKFSPEGDVLASASKDKTVRLWAPNAKADFVEIRGHTAAVRSVNFSRDSKILLTSSDDKTAKVFALPTRKFLCSLVGHSNWVRTSSLSTDTKHAVTGSDDKLVKIWDMNTTQCVHTFHDHDDHVNSVKYHQDNTCIVSGSADGSIKLWDVRSHQLIQHYPAHDAGVTSISLHPNGYYLASASKDQTLRLWDLREGRLLFSLQGHQGDVNATAFSADGNFIASGGVDKLVMVWKSNIAGVIPPKIEWGQGESLKTRPLASANTICHGVKAPKHDLNTSLDDAFTVRGKSAAPHVAPIRRPNLEEDHCHSQDQTAHSKRVSIPAPVLSSRSTEPSIKGMKAANSTTSNKDSQLNLTASTTSLQSAEDDLINRTELPANLAKTFDYIIGQLDMISTTMGLLDQRMSMIEDNVAVLNAKSRGLNTIPVTKHDSSERGKNKGTYTGTEGAIVNPNVSSSSDSVNGVSNTVFQWMKEEEDSGDVNNSNTQGLSESILNDFMNASLEDSVNAGTVSGTNTGVDVDDSNVSNCGSSSNTDTFEDNYVVEDEDENALNPDLDE